MNLVVFAKTFPSCLCLNFHPLLQRVYIANKQIQYTQLLDAAGFDLHSANETGIIGLKYIPI